LVLSGHAATGCFHYGTSVKVETLPMGRSTPTIGQASVAALLIVTRIRLVSAIVAALITLASTVVAVHLRFSVVGV
jgi:hypothetical protein